MDYHSLFPIIWQQELRAARGIAAINAVIDRMVNAGFCAPRAARLEA